MGFGLVMSEDPPAREWEDADRQQAETPYATKNPAASAGFCFAVSDHAAEVCLRGRGG